MTPLGLLGFELLRGDLVPLFLLAPVAFLTGLWSLAARRRARRLLVTPRHEARFLPGFSRSRAFLRVVLASGSALFLAFALLGPVRGYSLREVRRRGLDLVICIDTSRSMLVGDLEPDRMARAKREVSLLLDRLAGDRVALVAFSGDVRNVAPLTRDKETLRWFLAGLSPADNLIGGTDIGGALARGLELFDGRTGAHEALILLTDGEDLEGRGLEVAQEAAEHGIRVYVVGMGTEIGGKIPGRNGGYMLEGNGDEVVSSLQSATLESIADITGGAYLSAARTALPLEEIYEKRISRLEARDLQDGKERIPHDRFQWPLALALLCMLCETGLRERRTVRVVRAGEPT